MRNNRLQHALRHACFPLWGLSLTLAIPFFYQFAHEATRSSPLSPLTFDVVVDTGSSIIPFILTIAAALALAVILLAVCVSALKHFVDGRKRLSLGEAPASDGKAPLGDRALHLIVSGLCLVLLALGLLPAIENFLYTVTGFSLKTSTDAGSKIFVLAVAAVLATTFLRPIIALARRLSGSASLNILLLAGCATSLATGSSSVSGHAVSGLFHGNAAGYNVMIVSTDGINARQMSVYGHERQTTPFLDRMASQFLIFRNAFTNNAHTTGSVTSLLTGRSPITTQVVFPPDMLHGQDTVTHLPGILGPYGYHRSNWGVPHFADAANQNLIDGFDSNVGIAAQMDLATWLPINGTGLGAWLARRTVADIQTFALDILAIQEAPNPFDQITGGGNSLTDQQRLDGVLADIRSERPFFSHVHFMDTHGPRFSPTPHFSAGIEQTENFQTEFLEDAIRDFDARIAEIHKALEQAGKLESTILIITTDHATGYVPTERIPLLVRLPGATATGDVFENVQRLDLAPTILSLLGIPAPTWMEGLNMMKKIPDDRVILVTGLLVIPQPDGGTSRLFGSNHYLTGIFCDRFATFHLPLKLARSGTIPDTTSPCTVPEGEKVAQTVRRAVAKALAQQEARANRH